MDKVFLTILNMSLTGAFVIAAICLIRLPLKKAPKIISYCLWAMAGFRLVFPFSIESVFSLIPFKAQTIPLDITMQPIPRIDSGVTIVDNIISGSLPAPTLGASVSPLQIWTAIGTYVWLMGVSIMVIYGIVSYVLLKGKMGMAVHVDDNIYEAGNIQSPFVLGIIEPKIYIPPSLKASERKYIILHERTHIRRKDYIIKFAAYFILCLHWFNPLAWVAFLLMGVDMEMSCDERVLKELGGGTKKDYSMLLLSMATDRRTISGSPLAFGEGGVKERIKNILNFKKTSRVVIAAAVVLAVVVSVGFAVNKVNSIGKEDNTKNEIPIVYANLDNNTQVELVRFGYSWNYGDLSKSEQQIVEVDALTPFQYEYSPENTITVGDQATLKLSTEGEKLVKGYVEALSYTIWRPDGTVYDDGHREIYSSLSRRLGTDNNGNIILLGPFEEGEYIYGVNLKFQRGTVNYGFKIVVSYMNVPEAQELVGVHYPEATEIRYRGEKDISYTNPPAPVDVYTFEVDINDETVICAVSKERGIFFIYSDGTWFAFTGVGQKETDKKQILTLDDVRAMAQKIGTDLTMGDLEDFAGQDAGSGIYIMQYYVDDGPYLLVVGSIDGENILYANLIHATEGGENESIDIRYYDVDKFIENETMELVRELPSGLIDLPDFKPGNPIGVYDGKIDDRAYGGIFNSAILKQYGGSDKGFLVYAPTIHGVYEESGKMKALVTVHYEHYRLEGKTLTSTSGGIIVAAITFRQDDFSDGWILEEYTEVGSKDFPDGAYFADSIRKLCVLPPSGKENSGLAQKIINDYTDHTTRSELLRESLIEHLLLYGQTDVYLQKPDGNLEKLT
ncbi:M56 family metallopeptidase [Anaerocolumna aminovalerica]|uniref:M56 family metallopeptidase n=1 Tax=Anaerocolumna aminovalerica TaxID=1527 RepID=UPI000BE42E88|nr:M56 family metallopeptidase [Anaerocolumna aminovalerica]